MDVLAFFFNYGRHAWQQLFVKDKNEEDSITQRIFLALIEDVRSYIANGSESSPPMDPMVIPRLHMELDGFENSHITLENFEAKKLSTFVVDELTYTVISSRHNFYSIESTSRIPVLEINAEKYDLDITTPEGLHVFGTGWFKIKLNDIKLKAKIDFSIDDMKTLTVRNADVVVQLASIEPQITGLFNNFILNDTVELNLELLVPKVMTIFQNDISELINSAIVENGNIELTYGDAFVSQSTMDALKGLELALY